MSQITIEYLMIVQIIILVLILLTIYRKIESKEGFIICSNVILENISSYKITVLQNKINKIQKNYDLNVDSQTNSLSIFNKEIDKLTNESAKEIVRGLSKHTRKTLLKYYSQSGLILLIISNLRK